MSIAFMSDEQQRPETEVVTAVYRALLDPDVSVMEVHFALIGLALGIRTISDALALRAASFRLMASIAPAVVWGGVMLLIALIQLAGIATRSARLRTLGMLLQACYWIAITVLIGAAGPISWGPLIFGIMALSAGWSYLRLSARHHLHTAL